MRNIFLKYFTRVAFFMVGVFASGVIIEIGLRFLHYPQVFCRQINNLINDSFARFDPMLGWSYIPNKSTAGDYGVIYTFSKWGYRAVSTSTVPDFSKPRILIIGDSVLFGHGINFTDTFGYKLQQRLKEYEVINFAVQAYGTDQMYLMLQRVFDTYSPKFVVVDFIDEHLERNVSEDRREFYPCSRLVGTKPVFSVINNRLVEIYHPQTYDVYDNPRLLLLLRRVFGGSLTRRAAARGKEVTQKLFLAMKQYVEARGAKLLVLNLSNDFDLFPPENILGASIDLESLHNNNVFINHRDHHPNAIGTSILVDTFLNTFGNEFLHTKDSAKEGSL